MTAAILLLISGAILSWVLLSQQRLCKRLKALKK